MAFSKTLVAALAVFSAASVNASRCKPSPPVSSPEVTTTTPTEEPLSTSSAVITTSTVEEPLTTSTTVEEPLTTSTTVSAPATTTTASAPEQDVTCGITGYFLPGQALTYLYSPGYLASATTCLQACRNYNGCEVIAYYTNNGRCEFFKGELVTDGRYTVYQWYDVGCLDQMPQ